MGGTQRPQPASLSANHVSYPGTIGCAAGAAVLVSSGRW